MDSFYDAPRKPPQIPPRNRLPSAPVVPEISVLCSSNVPQRDLNDYATYSEWKTLKNPYQHWLTSNKENTEPTPNQQNISYLKKQVRFESPVLQQKPSITYEPILPKNKDITKEADPQLMRFEQMYLANIPNRQLDLSVIDLTKNTDKNTQKHVDIVQESNENNVQPLKTYKEYKDSQKDVQKKLESDKIVINDSVTDIFNYKRSPDTPVRYLGRFHPKVGDSVPEINLKLLEPPVRGLAGDNAQDNSFPNEIPNYELCNRYFPTSQPGEKLNFDYSKTPNRNDRTNQPKEALDDKAGPCFVFGGKNNTNFHSEKDAISKGQPIQNSESCKCNCKEALVVKNEDEPSVRDLLKIIAQQSQQIAKQNQQISQQNEQLLTLQKQVTTLISRDTRAEQEISKNKYVMGAQTEAYRYAQETPRKSNKRGFSIDFTTSVSFRGNFQNKTCKNQENMGPKIQEITESCGSSERSDDKTLMEPSMVFREPIHVRESCPSPEPSIKIDEMKDFEDSDAEDSDSDCSEISASFYKNLMTQVNNVLQKAQIKTVDHIQNEPVFHGRITNKTIHKVKEATMRHLSNIGVDVPDFDVTSSSSSSSEDNKSYDQSDVSFAVKQLLMKYLPDEHLAKVADKKPLVTKGNVGAIQARPEFSFATVEYMKKYNLIATQKQAGPKKHIIQQTPNTPRNDNILDISKLKQQPKLI